MVPVRNDNLIKVNTETEVIPTLTYKMEIFGDEFLG